MTPIEARDKIGFTSTTDVMHALKTGQIRARGNGDIIESTVDEFIKRRESPEAVEMRRLFHSLTSDLTPEEQQRLKDWRKPKKSR